jgi:cell division protein FtsL
LILRFFSDQGLKSIQEKEYIEYDVSTMALFHFECVKTWVSTVTNAHIQRQVVNRKQKVMPENGSMNDDGDTKEKNEADGI